MALVIPTLQGQIVNALKKAQKAPSTEAGNQILATELAKAIDAYIKSGTVTTAVTTAVTGVGGLYPGPVTGTGAGAGTGNVT
tara:strand:- start:111 stop:356 length:246 start_codon:yes stop_codon:yes gene_type:complete